MQTPTPEQLAEVNIHCFNDHYGIKTETGNKLDFTNHAFLWEPYSDFSPKLVCMKSAQIGFSTMAINKSLWATKNLGLDSIYTLPTSNDVKDFVSGKVNRIISHNPVFLEWVKDKDSVEQKSIDGYTIYYRGTWTERAALSTSADLVVNDELDRSKQEVIEQYESRLQHSKYQWRWIFSNPSINQFGVHKYWELSDQMHWFITCPSCKAKQFLSWPESIDIEKETYICKKCHTELPDASRKQGEWIPKYKDREWRGYWINLLMAPWVSASKIVDYAKTKSPEYFHNFVLGLPYSTPDSKPQEEDILQNVTDTMNPQDGTIVIGLDTGLTNWYVLGNGKGIFYHGSCEGYDEIESLLKKYAKSVLVADQGGDLVKIRELREKYPGRVFLCHYRQDRKTYQLIQWGEKNEYGNVVVDRNRMISALLGEFREKRIPLNGSREDFYPYWLHWNNIYKTSEEDSLGVPRGKWERTGADHLVHSTLYWRVGISKFVGGQAEFVGSSSLPAGVQNSIAIRPDNTYKPGVDFTKIPEPEEDWRTR